jgi:ASC-1-like (ASCH) protein
VVVFSKVFSPAFGTMATETTTSSASKRPRHTACHLRRPEFDWRFGDEKNANALAELRQRSPSSFEAAKRLRATLPLIFLHNEGTKLRPDLTTGVVEARLPESDLISATHFEQYMLDNVLHGKADGIPSYAKYDLVAGDHAPSLQACRTHVLTNKKDIANYLPDIPGALRMLQAVLSCLGLPAGDWRKYTFGYNGLIQDEFMQTTFLWHEDATPQSNLSQSVVTAVIQCSEGTPTAMQMLHFEPKYYDQLGSISIFNGYCPHKSIPWTKDIAANNRVVKCVFFLLPDKACRYAQQWHTPARTFLYTVGSLTEGHLSSRRELLVDFVVKRARFEAIELGELGEEVDEESTEPIFAHRSALQSLYRMVKWSDGKPDSTTSKFFVQWVWEADVAEYKTVTGIIWFTLPSTVEADIWCIAAFKGYGTTLHSAWCTQLQSTGIGTVFAKMALCRLKRGPWLAGLGYRQPEARSLEDGDMLMLQLDAPSSGGSLSKSMSESAPEKDSKGILRWSDGSLARRGHGTPYLQPEYADAILNGEKYIEGRPFTGWLLELSANDWITFKVSTRRGQVVRCRAVKVERFSTFKDMLQCVGVTACLPRCTSLDQAIGIYHALADRHGSKYSDLERHHGVVAITLACY